jgi:hypothetical protein
MVNRVIMIVVTVIFVVLFTLIIFGILTRPKLPAINIVATKAGKFNKVCLREKTSCNTDDDCRASCVESNEGESIVCKSIPNTAGLTNTQQSLMSSQGPSDSLPPPKYCVPEKAKLECNVGTGGIPVFSGWGGGDTMSFECLCSYPVWASSKKCEEKDGSIYCEGNCLLNPDICRGGVFNWDLTKNSEEPTAELCTCADGDVLIVDDTGLPRCVPENLQAFYSDLELSIGNKGSQQPIHIDNISGITLGSACATSGPTVSQTTTCGTGCCPLPTDPNQYGAQAVCCEGADFCCSASFPICDIPNKRCLKDIGFESEIVCQPSLNTPLEKCVSGCCPTGTTCNASATLPWQRCVKDSGSQCGTSETVCAGGCCPSPGATCCGDGITCCPANFPICDSERKACNPPLTPLKTSARLSANDKQCPNNAGSCPFKDGICCGDGLHCCPPEYPVCDAVLGCRKPNP